MATETFAGSVDCLVFAFPEGAELDAGLHQVLGCVAAGTIELLDLEVIGRNADGGAVRRSIEDLAGSADPVLQAFVGAESGVLDADDLAQIAGLLEAGQFALAIVYENRSLAAAADAWTKVGGTELLSGGVDINDLAQAVDGGTD